MVDALQRMHGTDLAGLLALSPQRAAERAPATAVRPSSRMITDAERALLAEPAHAEGDDGDAAAAAPGAATAAPSPPPAPVNATSDPPSASATRARLGEAPRTGRLTSKMRALASPVPSRAPQDDSLAAIARLMRQVTEAGGVEVYLRGGAVPTVKYWNKMAPLGRAEIAAAQVEKMAKSILGPRREATAAAVDLSFEVESMGRCRARVHQDAKGLALVLRPLGFSPPRLSDVGADPLLDPLPELSNGLVLVSGAAAGGKTWTALALVEAINSARAVHIATVESPVEHVNFPRPGFMSQVDVPGDFPTMLGGPQFARNSGASVIYAGDVPDEDTALLLLEEAAGGTLVIATLRATGAVEAIRKVVELASAKSPNALQLMCKALRASIRQALLPHVAGKSLVAAREVLTAVPRVLAPINLGRFAELEDVLARGTPIDGCRSMEAAIKELKRRDLIGRID